MVGFIIMDKDAYIKKLEHRIHKQRVMLRDNWQIVEDRMAHRPTPLRSMWWKYVLKLSAEVKELKKRLREGG